MDELKRVLAKERFQKEFGIFADQLPKHSNTNDGFDETVEEETIRESEKRSAQKGLTCSGFVELEKLQRIKGVRNMIQSQVDDRMKETENEQFDIEWDDDQREGDITQWIKTLGRFGRNTKEIQNEFDAIKKEYGD